MERNLFGLFTALLAVACVLCALQSYQKRRYGLTAFFILNAFTNLVNTIHAIYNTLF